MYIAVKGGEQAIAASLRLLEQARRGDPQVAALQIGQLREQLGLLVDRVMAEASLCDPDLAALALKQSRGDPIEAVFLLRAYRSTLPRFGYSEPLPIDQMRLQRRVSAIFKDLPGGQVLGPTFDYSQRLLDFELAREPAFLAEGQDEGARAPIRAGEANDDGTAQPDVEPSVPPRSALDHLAEEGLIEAARPSEGDPEPPDITRDPPIFPLSRAARLQMLARADEGWVLGLGYSTQRGYASTHPFGGEIRYGHAPVTLVPDELGFPIEIGEVPVTECQMINQFVGSADVAPQFTRGYGLVFGYGERKAMAMSLVDRVMRYDEFDEQKTSPAQDAEFALSHGDNVEASGFVQHLKLPHYVTFESELALIRALRAATSNVAPPDQPPAGATRSDSMLAEIVPGEPR